MKKLPLILNITVYLMLFLLSSCLPPNKTPPPVKTLPGQEGSGGSGGGGGGDTRPALYPPNNSVYVQGRDPGTLGKDVLIFKGNKACLTTTSTTLNSKQTLLDSCTSPVSITITPSHTFVLSGVTYTIDTTTGDIISGAGHFSPVHFPLIFTPTAFVLWTDGGAIAAGKRMVIFSAAAGMVCVGDIKPADIFNSAPSLSTQCGIGDYPLYHYTVTSNNQLTIDGTVYTMAPAGATLTGGGKTLTLTH